MFITFEGPEGGGKSTQIAQLRDWLTERGYHVLTTREPGGTPVGDQLRAILLDKRNQIAPIAEFLLYSASRAQLVETCIRPHLAAGGIVLCDRFADSSIAYQGYGRGLNLTTLRQVTHAATGGLWPDLTLLLDIDPAQGLTRRHQSGEALDRMDSQTLDFHEQVRAGYFRLMAAEPERWALIRADQSPDKVFQQIVAVVGQRLAVP